jgi:hypothetical protein
MLWNAVKTVALVMTHYTADLFSRVHNPVAIGTYADGQPPTTEDSVWVRMKKVVWDDFVNSKLLCKECFLYTNVLCTDCFFRPFVQQFQNFVDNVVVSGSAFFGFNILASWHSWIAFYYQGLAYYQTLNLAYEWNWMRFTSFTITLSVGCITFAFFVNVHINYGYRIWWGRVQGVLYFVSTWWKISILVLFVLYMEST